MLRTKIALGLIYFLFAVLLNSVGTAILQSQASFLIGKKDAAILEAFKDLPIAITSFLVAAQLPRWGYRRSMIVGLSLLGLVCMALPFVPGFWSVKLLFAACGIAFAVIKIGVYSSIGLLTNGAKEHASLLSWIEGGFMIGVLSGYFLFAAFIDNANPASTHWLRAYAVLGAASLIIALFLCFCPMDESAARQARDDGHMMRSFGAMMALIVKPVTYVFVLCLFFYVLIEQGVGTWLPTFNKEVLGLNAAMSVQATSLFAASIALGRILSGFVLRVLSWPVFLGLCIAAMAAIIALTLPLTPDHKVDVQSWQAAPLVVFLFPFIGFFMSPIYPTLSSAVLSASPKNTHAGMTGLIVIFSALGGTTGSFIIGRLFDALDGKTAFYCVLIPIAVLAFLVWNLSRLHAKSAPEGAAR